MKEINLARLLLPFIREPQFFPLSLFFRLLPISSFLEFQSRSICWNGWQRRHTIRPQRVIAAQQKSERLWSNQSRFRFKAIQPLALHISFYHFAASLISMGKKENCLRESSRQRRIMNIQSHFRPELRTFFSTDEIYPPRRRSKWVHCSSIHASSLGTPVFMEDLKLREKIPLKIPLMSWIFMNFHLLCKSHLSTFIVLFTLFDTC